VEEKAQDRSGKLADATGELVDGPAVRHPALALLNWRRSLCAEPDGAVEQKSGFVPAMVVADPIALAPATPANGHMVIEIGKDRCVIVDTGVDAAALASVLAILKRR